MSAALLTDEHYRILRAASQGRLRISDHGRWVMAGEARPDRRSREQLVARGLISHGFWTASITDKGREVLAARPS